nr:immunoglobulin heavy chain junction region [Mus musculus]
CARHGMDYW